MGERPKPGPWTIEADGLLLTVRLTPKGGRDAIDGIVSLADGSSLVKARVRAAPTEGEANTALIQLLAKSLRIAPGQVSVVSGATSRVKRVMIAGDGGVFAKAMEKIVGLGQ